MVKINDNAKRYLISLVFGVSLGLTFLTILRKVGIKIGFHLKKKEIETNDKEII